MRFRDLDLNLLVALDALLTERNVSLAGRRVHLKQSAMSAALSRLRRYFDDDLLINVGRHMALSPLAESLVEPVREALRQIEATILSPPEKSFDPRTSQRMFSILASDDLVDSFLAPALRNLGGIAPQVGFELRFSGDEPPEALQRGLADLLLVQEPYAAAQHPRRVLFDDEYVVVAWSQSRQIGARLTAETFLAASHVIVRFAGGRRGASWEELAFQRLPKRRAAVLVPDFSSVPHLVVGTDRIATMHRRHALLYARFMPLKLLACPIRIPRVRYVVQWHSRNDSDAGLAWLAKALVGEARK
jgi:LysR family transcriptional regulator, nod-box dependent transcriptional activator